MAKEKGVKLDFSDKKKEKSVAGTSPFQKAEKMEKRLKLLLWGDSGAGKTTLALQFPNPVVIDLEGGTDHYGEAYKFDVLKTSTADQVMESINWLQEKNHSYRTLVIDPITIYWDSLQKKWSDILLKHNKKSKGYKFEYYDMQVKDWQAVKGEFKELIRKLIMLDMNIIVTARQKTKYADGEMMKAIGETFDGEKSLPYLFDTIVRLYRDEKGKYIGENIKDRTNNLPVGAFKCSYKLFQDSFGKAALQRKAEKGKEVLGQAPSSPELPVAFISLENLEKIKGFIRKAHKSSSPKDGCSLEKINSVLSTYNVDVNTLHKLPETKFPEVLDTVIELKNSYGVKENA